MPSLEVAAQEIAAPEIAGLEIADPDGSPACLSGKRESQLSAGRQRGVLASSTAALLNFALLKEVADQPA